MKTPAKEQGTNGNAGIKPTASLGLTLTNLVSFCNFQKISGVLDYCISQVLSSHTFKQFQAPFENHLWVLLIKQKALVDNFCRISHRFSAFSPPVLLISISCHIIDNQSAPANTCSTHTCTPETS